MGNIISIREFISEMYPDAETLPQELLESCEALFEATKRDVQLKVYFQQAFDALRKKKWTVDKIDKEIKKIEKCNKLIEEAQQKSAVSPKYLKLLSSGTFWEDVIKQCFYACALGLVSAAFMKALYGAVGMLFNAMGTRAGSTVKMMSNIATPLAAFATTADYISDRVYDGKDTDKNVFIAKKHLVMYEKLHNENEKAIEWLKEERERILNGTAKKKKLGDIITGKQESTNIFCAIELI